MDTESESPRKPPLPGIAWPSAFLVVVGLFAYLNYRPPLETMRPEVASVPCEPAPTTVESVGTVHARLWEDPLEAVYRDEKRRDAGGSFWRPGGVPCLGEEGFKEIVAQARLAGNGELLFMPVLVSGAPYAEDKEKRMRTRYALLAALGARGYKLALGDRMSYVHVNVKTAFDVMAEGVTRRLAVPVKLYRRDPVVAEAGHYGGVLVCWLNESQLGDRPLSAVWQVYEQLFPEDEVDREAVSIKIIGPSGSDALRQMVNNVNKKKDDREHVPEADLSEEATFYGFWVNTLRRIVEYVIQEKKDNRSSVPEADFPEGTKLYSPWATVTPEVIEWGETEWIEGDAKRAREFSLKRANIDLIRTCGTDRQLARALLRELTYRTPWPANPHTFPSDSPPKQHIVLVTEHDTLYGRAIPEAFRREIDGESSPERNSAAAGGAPKVSGSNLHVFTYLRGIDGARPGNGESQEKRETNGKNGDDEGLTEGRAQLDYLRRLEQRITGLEERLRHDGEGRIMAIGVVGSDIYDKLLVLRALRRQFPRVTFFTTDLDAGLWRPSEYPHTRNIVVASHFGLSLADELQPRTPPFRDSYQTAVFFSTLLALKHRKTETVLAHETCNPNDPWGLAAEDSAAPCLEPLVFEIGRSGAYQFTDSAGGLRAGRGAVHAEFSGKRHWIESRWIPLSIMLVCLLLFLSMSFKAVCWTATAALRRTGVLLSVVVALIFLVWFGAAIGRDHGAPDGEPFLIFEGISIWPSTIMRLATAVLAVLFLFKGLRDLARNDDELLESYFRQGLGRPAGTWDRLLTWPDARRPGWLAGWPQVTAALQGLCFAWCWPRPTGDAPTPGAHRLEQQYRFLEQWPWRLARIILLTLLYYVFVHQLFKATEFPYMPYRGETSHWIGKWMLRAAVFGMLALLFFVIDAAGLCRRHILVLKERDCRWSDADITGVCEQWKYVDRADLCDLLAVRLIAQRTDVVGKLIYWPCIIILLLTLSRLRVFDNWDFSWPLIAVIGLSLAGAVISGIRLRRAANRARLEILQRLKDSRAAAAGDSRAKAKREQLKLLITEIETKRQGAFTPWVEDPILVSLVLPFGGVSGLIFIEHLFALF